MALNRRLERVASLLKEEISRILIQEIQDPRLGFITVTEVIPSPDLHFAKVFYSVIGKPSQQRTTQRGLDEARPRVQALIGDRCRLKYTPKLRFVFDPSVAGAARVSNLIDRALEGATVDDIEDEPDAPLEMP